MPAACVVAGRGAPGRAGSPQPADPSRVATGRGAGGFSISCADPERSDRLTSLLLGDLRITLNRLDVPMPLVLRYYEGVHAVPQHRCRAGMADPMRPQFRYAKLCAQANPRLP